MNTIEGIIIKGIGGFYYVQSKDGHIHECKARGVFRKNKLSPCAGDKVLISLPDEGYSAIEKVLPRKNSLVRPPIVNIDLLVIVVSTCEPLPSTLVIDKMMALATYKGIEPVLVITKSDLCSVDELRQIYLSAGINTIVTSILNDNGIDDLKRFMSNKISVFTGNTGVGKSTLLNHIMPELMLQTGDISKKLGRGKHTTRHVELFRFDGGYIADTTGFSTVDIERYEIIKKGEIQYCFTDFAPYINSCRFTSCSHTCEKGCSVIEALNEGKIQKSRYDSYIAMYNEVKDIKDWEIK